VLLSAACVTGWVLDDSTVSFEQHVMARIATARSPALTAVAKALSTIGSLAVVGPAAAAAAAWLVHHGRSRSALSIAVVAVGAVALTDLVKIIIERPRPRVAHLVAVSSTSFPSQHAAQAAAILPALALALMASSRRRAIAVLGAAAAALAIGLSRVYLGVHYPTDVLVGWVIGFVWLVLVLRVMGTYRAGQL
jgi:membrane-associated phospholipid phosphatase